MGVKNFIGIWVAELADGTRITSGNSPIAFRDGDQTLDWIQGTHLYNGVWQFNIPSGYAGWEVGVETAIGTYTRDDYLSGVISGDNLGALLAPVNVIES